MSGSGAKRSFVPALFHYIRYANSDDHRWRLPPTGGRLTLRESNERSDRVIKRSPADLRQHGVRSSTVGRKTEKLLKDVRQFRSERRYRVESAPAQSAAAAPLRYLP